MKLSRIAVLAFAAALAPAAARAQTAQPDLPPMMEVTHEGEMDIRVAPTVRIIEGRFAASADSVWAVLPDALRDLGIDPQVDPSRERVMGNPRITGGRVAGQRTGRFMTCGNDNAGPAAAAQYRIMLNLVTQVRPEATGARTFTRVIGTASSVQGSGTTVMGCTTTGQLERRINEAIQARLAGTPVTTRN